MKPFQPDDFTRMAKNILKAMKLHLNKDKESKQLEARIQDNIQEYLNVK